MINRDRVLKLIRDIKEWQLEFNECLNSIDVCDEKMKKIVYHSVRAYFWDLHILCEDFISINLKDLSKFKVDISAVEGMEIISNLNRISRDFFNFYSSSRRLRNRLAHRYKMPSDEELLLNLKENLGYINELENMLKTLIK